MSHFEKMRWQVALAIPVIFTGFLILLEAIENILNRAEGHECSVSSSQNSLPSLVSQQQAPAQPPITTRVEWPLPWATLEVDYRDYANHIDDSPRLVDRSHVAQLPYQEKSGSGSGSGACGGAGDSKEQGPFFHLKGINVRDIEDC